MQYIKISKSSYLYLLFENILNFVNFFEENIIHFTFNYYIKQDIL